MNPIHHRLALETKGFLADIEGRRLYELALDACSLGPCLEIGGYCAKSSIYLGSACKEKAAVLFSVDHHFGSEEQQPGELYFDPEMVDPYSLKVNTLPHFLDAIRRADLADTVIAMVASSAVCAKAWKTPLSLIFIDGGHAEETVASDFRMWVPHLLPAGYLVFHDIYPDPADGGQAPYHVYRSAMETGMFTDLPMTGSLGILQRKRA